ncbi:MAG: glycosyltransferase family 2 protein [Verrucomicrobiales bacterium]|jgi:dolichol-phosphate mannosyltransferase|nr:glycosyltransferase family 2 protein [Verrucomicrobiales bacterium]
MKSPGYTSPFQRQPGLRNSSPSLDRVSVVVPFYNEEECVEFVLKEIVECQPDAEVIAVDDGSSDKTWEIMQTVEGVTPLRLSENRGQSGALFAGLNFASGDILVMLDGDGQNDPADIEKLLGLVRSGDCDIAVGRRAKRQDTFSRKLASRIANTVRRWFIHDGISDTGCSLKAIHRDHVDLLVPFNGMHRFLPAVFTNAGLKIDEIDVNHRERKGGESKYTNFDRAIRGVYDLVGVCWLLKRKVILPPVLTREDQE